MGDEKASNLAYVKSDLQVVGGPAGVGTIQVTPPWQGERCEAVLVAVSAWGNTGTNLIYITADSGIDLMGGGAAQLLKPTNGTIVAINGVDTKPLFHAALGVTQYLRVLPAAAANGQIYLTFYWQKVLNLAGPLHIPAPRPPQLEPMNEESEVWQKVSAKNPRAYLKQNPAQLPPQEQESLSQFKKRIDQRLNLQGRMPTKLKDS